MYLPEKISAEAGDILEMRYSFTCRLGSGQYFLAAGVARRKGDTEYEVVHLQREAYDFVVMLNSCFGGDIDLQAKIVSIKTIRDSKEF
jgi:hypothetical protein